jgi:hypothetical protein
MLNNTYTSERFLRVCGGKLRNKEHFSQRRIPKMDWNRHEWSKYSIQNIWTTGEKMFYDNPNISYKH